MNNIAATVGTNFLIDPDLVSGIASEMTCLLRFLFLIDPYIESHSYPVKPAWFFCLSYIGQFTTPPRYC